MKVPFSWLKEFIDPGMPAAELARRLTMAGLEAEKIEEIGADWDRVFVGLVQEVQQHPNADRLFLAEVEAGEHRLTVVTGAPNILAGQKVALALTGASLIDGHSDTGARRVLKPVNMRGIVSEGMVCSEKELGLSEEHEGIITLDDDAPVGVPLRDYLGDTVIEFEITPNLVHAFSVHGIARETHALTGNPLALPALHDLSRYPAAGSELVVIENENLCARYMAIVVDSIEIADSPAWLTRRLTAAGLRPVSNIVDITNYVMLEFGQPLHAFDLDHLDDERIVVRTARSGETIETLDHQVRNLTPAMLVIADASKPVAIAGVMGGIDSEVTAATRSILLEGANFNMKSVRQTARSLKLRSDASTRFERGLDPELVLQAMCRATELILQICPGARIRTVADIYPVPVEHVQLTMPFDRIERVLGIAYPESQVLEILQRLEFAPKLDGDAGHSLLTVSIPSYRHDVSLAEDIVEEVARIAGYDTLPSTLPRGATMPVFRDPVFQLQKEIRHSLTGAGLYEAVTYLTTSEETISKFLNGDTSLGGLLSATPVDQAIRLKNPIQVDRGLLRTTLAPALLEITSQNLRHQETVRFFETARVFEPVARNDLPNERNLLGIVLAGKRESLSRFETTGSLDFFDLKGVVELLLQRISRRPVTFERREHPALHPGRSAAALVDGAVVAVFGELLPAVATAFNIDVDRVAVAELDIDALVPLAVEPLGDVTVPRYLPVAQDFAVVVAGSVDAGAVEAAIMAGAGPLATGIALFDIYEGAQIGEGNKSLAFRVTFLARDRALTDAELVKVRIRIEQSVKKRVSGTLRA